MLTWRDYKESRYTIQPRVLCLYNFLGSEFGLWLLLQHKFLLTTNLMNYIPGTCSLQRGSRITDETGKGQRGNSVYL